MDTITLNIKKKLLLFLLAIFTLNCVFGAFVLPTENNGMSFDYQIWKIDSDYNLIYQTNLTTLQTTSNLGDYIIIFYPNITSTTKDDENFVLKVFLANETGTNFSFSKYTNDVDGDLAIGNVCEFTNVQSKIVNDKLNIHLDSLLHKLKINGHIIPNAENKIEDLLDKYYNTKVFVFARLVKDTSDFNYHYDEEFFFFEDNLDKDIDGKYKLYAYNDNRNTKIEEFFYYEIEDIDSESDDELFLHNNFYTYFEGHYNEFKTFYNITNVSNHDGKNAIYMPYVLVGMKGKDLSLDLNNFNSKILATFPSSDGYEYNVETYAIPIDGKCDIVDSNLMANFSQRHLSNNEDFKSTEITDSQKFKVAYDKKSAHLLGSWLKKHKLKDQSSFHNDLIVGIGTRRSAKNMYFKKKQFFFSKNTFLINNIPEYETDEGTIVFLLDGSDINNAIQQDIISKKIFSSGSENSLQIFVKNSKLKVQFENSTQNTSVESSILKSNKLYYVVFSFGGKGMKLYINGNLEDENTSTSGIENNNASMYIGGSFNITGASTYNNFFKGFISYLHFYDKQYNLSELSDLTPERILRKGTRMKRFTNYDIYTNKLHYVYDSVTNNEITLPTFNASKKIEIYKNGINVRNDTIDPVEIGLVSHQIKDMKSKADVENFIQRSYSLMTKMNIQKDLSYNSTSRMTTVKIKLDLPTSHMSNITIYQVLEKDILSDFKDIKFESGNATISVIDQDPVIGWYFNESNTSDEIEYKIPGDNEGGTIVITQEPILFNDGDLVVNYRDTGCNPNEVELFQLDDLENSNLYKKGSGKDFSVCISHLTELLKGDDTGTSSIHLFNFTNGGEMSFDYNFTTPQSVDLSMNRDDVYWSVLVQKNNPDGTYTCIGSMSGTGNTSKFGDCGYTQNRIWIHVGADYYAPKSELKFPIITHNLEVILSSKDEVGGSGVKEQYYCVVNTTNNCLNTNTFIQYTHPFFVTCNTLASCKKTVKYYAKDFENNTEDVKTDVLNIIESGSVCQPDCSVNSLPGRYAAGCNNLNHCEYYKYDNTGVFDDGEYVSKLCDLRTLGSWTKFNTTHDIKCPMGDFRQSILSNSSMNISGEACKFLDVMPYKVLIDGEVATMNIVFCADK